MSFNLYFAGWGSKDADQYLREKNAHRLLSFANEKKLITSWCDDGLGSRLLIDSGAYSVAHSNVTIDIDEYIEYIKNHKDINNWIELDVIPYPTITTKIVNETSSVSWENFKYMQDRLVELDGNVLPVYHYGEPKSALKRILNTKINGEYIDYICIGGKQTETTDVQVAYFNDVFTIIQESENPNVKVHVLGMTIPRVLEKFPFYSADSTTWLQTAINGTILLDDLTTVMISDGTKHNKLNIQSLPESACKKVYDTVEKYGYNFSELCADYKKRLRFNIDVMLNWEQHYTYKGPKEFKSQKLF